MNTYSKTGDGHFEHKRRNSEKLLQRYSYPLTQL